MESNQLHWSIIKGLPEKEGTYIVTIRDAEGNRKTTIAKFDGNSFIHPYRVLAWANDPLPYQGEANDG